VRKLTNRIGKFFTPYLIGALFIIVFFASSMQSMSTTPENAQVHFNSVSKTFMTPPCKAYGNYSNAETATQARGTIEYLSSIGEFDDVNRVISKYGDMILTDQAWSNWTITLIDAKKRGLTPDIECQNSGGFGHSENTFLVWIGASPPSNSRWNEDGTWNW